MAAYYLIITDHGRSALSAAQAGTAPFDIAQLVLGDANGQPYLPQSRANATALLNQLAAVDVERVQVIGDMVEVSAIVESNIGGFNIHEIGLTDGSGQLLYLGNYHGGYKPVLTEGAGGDLTLVLDLATSHLATVVIPMDSTVITASKQWVIDNFVRIPTFNAHVAQNAIEHANLLALIAQLNAALAIANENIMDNQTIQNIQSTLTLMQERLVALEQNAKEDIKVGDLFFTAHNFLSPQEVATHKAYGTWIKWGQGDAIVGHSDYPDSPEWTKTIGQRYGSYEHTLTLSELPSDPRYFPRFTGQTSGDNPVINIDGNGPMRYEDNTEYQIGSGQGHNNVQPSVVVGIWLRTA